MSWSTACGAGAAGELGRCGMSPRTCEGATPREHRSMVGARSAVDMPSAAGALVQACPRMRTEAWQSRSPRRRGTSPAAPCGSAHHVDPRARREGDLPGPTSLPAAHQVSPPWPACQAPTNPPTKQEARPSRSRIAVPPYSRRSLLAVLIRGSGLKAGPDEAGAVSNPGPAAVESLVSCWPAQVGRGGAGVCRDLGRSRSMCSAALTGSWSSRCAPVRVASSAVAPAPPRATML
jgi:hypothetical protein